MLNSKQRAYLRSLANKSETILIIGKGGISEKLIIQAEDALKKRELIKGKILKESSPIDVRQAADELAAKTSSEVVQVIGSKFILYKQNKDKPKIKQIKLP